jgi:hypothetical protein
MTESEVRTRPRPARLLAPVAAALLIGGVAIGGADMLLNFLWLQGLAFSAVGWVVCSRRPESRIGPLFAVAGGFQAASVFTSEYSAAVAGGRELPASTLVAWVDSWVYMPALVIFFLFLPLLFPTGTVPARAWRPVFVGGLVVGAAVVVAPMLRPGPLDSSLAVTNPIGIGSRSFWEGIDGLGMLLVFAGSGLAVASLIARFRRSRGQERLQLKWYVYGAALLPVAFLSFIVFDTILEEEGWERVIAIPAYLAPPITAGIAILRYRLFEIDRIVNRTLVYGSLTVALAAVYYGGAVLAQTLLGDLVRGSRFTVAASTLVAVGLFRPLRAGIQGAIDRRFNRHKYDAERVVERFSDRLRQEVDIENLTRELASAVDQSMAPAHISLWFLDGGRGEGDRGRERSGIRG